MVKNCTSSWMACGFFTMVVRIEFQGTSFLDCPADPQCTTENNSNREMTQPSLRCGGDGKTERSNGWVQYILVTVQSLLIHLVIQKRK